jgi:UDP-N-acetylglucosamine--N-acetylmuramyl-(pentapeptide) pyrophosphoryl-undecaprenol N-acetylglucosamine transferase
MVKRVCLVSGGTGGHLMPALVLGRALRERGHEALLVTEGREVEREFLQQQRGPGIEEIDLPEGRPSRFGLPLWLLRTTRAARAILREREVDCVVSTGGRPSLPVGLAAKSLGKPLFLLEQNAVPGRVNRCLLPFARRMYLGLPPAGKEPAAGRAVLTGTPLRPELYSVDRAAARAALGLGNGQPVVLVTGGSQGAMALNRTAPHALRALPVQVFHLSGLGNEDSVRRLYAEDPQAPAKAIVRPVAMDMDHLLGAADLVICRGGGTTVAELMAAGRAAIIVPYPHHKDRQQLRNAEVLVRAGAALVVEESELSVDRLQDIVADLLLDPGRLCAMGTAARALRARDPTAAILADMQGQGGLS